MVKKNTRKIKKRLPSQSNNPICFDKTNSTIQILFWNFKSLTRISNMHWLVILPSAFTEKKNIHFSYISI